MGLFGTKSKLHLSVDEQPIVAGRPMTVRWSTDVAERNVRGGRLELYYRNRYRYQSGDDQGTHESKRTVDVPVQTITLFTGEPPTGEQQVTVELPPTPASAPKGVEWHLRLVMDRPGRDGTVEQELDVRAPADGLDEWITAPATSSGGDCTVAVQVDRRTARPGETIRGTVDIRATAPISARSIRAELVRKRNERDGIVKRDATGVDLAGTVDLQAGQQLQYHFELPVPPDAEPSFKAKHNSQHWLVCCVVDRRLKTDFTGEVEVVVHNAP